MATSAGNTALLGKNAANVTQLLSYSAYKRHQNPLVCTEAGPSNEVTGTLLYKLYNKVIMKAFKTVLRLYMMLQK